MNRGRRSEAIFSGKEDFQMFRCLRRPRRCGTSEYQPIACCQIIIIFFCRHRTGTFREACGTSTAVCAFYDFRPDDLKKIQRGMFNEPRNAAVYLMRKIRRDRLKEIGELFGIGKYSSVSSMIEGTKQRMKTDRSFRKRINELYRSIINSQKQTWPLFTICDIHSQASWSWEAEAWRMFR